VTLEDATGGPWGGREGGRIGAAYPLASLPPG